MHWPLLEMNLLFCFQSGSETNDTQIYHLHQSILKHGTKPIKKWKLQRISVEGGYFYFLRQEKKKVFWKKALFFLRQQDSLFSHGGKGSVLVWFLLLARRIGACPRVIAESPWRTTMFLRLFFTTVHDNPGIFYSWPNLKHLFSFIAT